MAVNGCEGRESHFSKGCSLWWVAYAAAIRINGLLKNKRTQRQGGKMWGRSKGRMVGREGGQVSKYTLHKYKFLKEYINKNLET